MSWACLRKASERATLWLSMSGKNPKAAPWAFGPPGPTSPKGWVHPLLPPGYVPARSASPPERIKIPLGKSSCPSDVGFVKTTYNNHSGFLQSQYSRKVLLHNLMQPAGPLGSTQQLRGSEKRLTPSSSSEPFRDDRLSVEAATRPRIQLPMSSRNLGVGK